MFVEGLAADFDFRQQPHFEALVRDMIRGRRPDGNRTDSFFRELYRRVHFRDSQER
jgi:hypothetical protein